MNPQLYYFEYLRDLSSVNGTTGYGVSEVNGSPPFTEPDPPYFPQYSVSFRLLAYALCCYQSVISSYLGKEGSSVATAS